MTSVKELIERYNAEQVCDRLIAEVDGKREYIADLANGGFMYTAAGLRLEAQWEESQAKKPAPKAKGGKAQKSAPEETTDVDNEDLLAGLGDE